jgi:hypothetical protein
MAVSLSISLNYHYRLTNFPEASKKHRQRLLCRNMTLGYELSSSLWIALCADHLVQCYLCPGNKRAQGDSNPQYKSTFVFVNDYSAVKDTQAEYKPEEAADGKRALVPSFTEH